jgi:methyl-accepting chemotaxis protein
MAATLKDGHPPEMGARRAAFLFEEHRHLIYGHTDRLFGFLLLAQWLAAIVAAWLITPRTWAGQYSQVHVHIRTAIFLGGAISLLPVILALPGSSAGPASG